MYMLASTATTAFLDQKMSIICIGKNIPAL